MSQTNIARRVMLCWWNIIKKFKYKQNMSITINFNLSEGIFLFTIKNLYNIVIMYIFLYNSHRR